MTYFTYLKGQYSDYEEDRPAVRYFTGNPTSHSMIQRSIDRYTEPPKKFPRFLPKPAFMPSRLVRISDMEVVRGSEVNEGYCTLSYSWNQSGELVTNKTTGEIDRIDQGEHAILTMPKFVPHDPNLPHEVKLVKFEGLIQEICKDFNVKYLWYDQMCINQDNKEEKHGEIRQMHKIYRNAYCTVVLVPELHIRIEDRNKTTGLHEFTTDYSTLVMSQWMKRVWTLEETLMSSRMLFIGTLTHTWWHQISPENFPIFRKDRTFNVATILHYAHARTSSKEHDHVFALANSIPEVMKKITIDYDQDIEELMIRFYGILAEKDIRILCFGPHTHYKYMCATSITKGRPEEYTVPIQKYDLPSWTGVDGEHLYEYNYETPFKNYTVTGRTMQIKCTGITNDPHNTVIRPSAPITPADLPPLPLYCATLKKGSLVVPVRLQNCSNISIWSYCELLSSALLKIIVSDNHGFDYKNNKEIIKKVIENFSMFAHFLPIRKEDIQWIYDDEVPFIMFDFRHLTEHLDASSHYTLLTGVQFRDSETFRREVACPVIKKKGNYYQAIGLCTINDDASHLLEHTFSKEQVYEIQ